MKNCDCKTITDASLGVEWSNKNVFTTVQLSACTHLQFKLFFYLKFDLKYSSKSGIRIVKRFTRMSHKDTVYMYCCFGETMK